MYALSGPGKLEDVLAAARLNPLVDDTLEASAVFPDAAGAVDAFLSAGATGLAREALVHGQRRAALFAENRDQLRRPLGNRSLSRSGTLTMDFRICKVREVFRRRLLYV
jgi:hypothetical protein